MFGLFVILLHIAVVFLATVVGLVDALGIFGDSPDYKMAAVFSGVLIFWGVLMPWVYRWDRRRWKKFRQQQRESEERERAAATRNLSNGIF